MKNKIFGFLAIIMLVTWAILYFLPPKKANAPAEISPSPTTPSIGDEIKVYSPKPSDVVTSPLKLTGKARGSWFFEASMPATLRDADKNIIAGATLSAKGEWTTSEFVEFEGEMTFEARVADTGFLVFENDNPSGLAENRKSYMIPVRFR